MTKPLALVFYEELLPGSQLVNRLQDLGYRVQTILQLSELAGAAEKEKPMVLLMDLKTASGDVGAAIRQIRTSAQTSHLPILAFTGKRNRKLQESATEAGASLVAFDDAILKQLPQLLEQVLQVD
jgi:CheY-like chemotaxis protein